MILKTQGTVDSRVGRGWERNSGKQQTDERTWQQIQIEIEALSLKNRKSS